MSYNVSAFYVAETYMKNRLKALHKPIIGINHGTNAPVIKANDNELLLFKICSVKYKYFIASRWRNKDLVLELLHKLRTKGKVVYRLHSQNHYVEAGKLCLREGVSEHGAIFLSGQ